MGLEGGEMGLGPGSSGPNVSGIGGGFPMLRVWKVGLGLGGVRIKIELQEYKVRQAAGVSARG